MKSQRPVAVRPLPRVSGLVYGAMSRHRTSGAAVPDDTLSGSNPVETTRQPVRCDGGAVEEPEVTPVELRRELLDTVERYFSEQLSDAGPREADRPPTDDGDLDNLPESDVLDVDLPRDEQREASTAGALFESLRLLFATRNTASPASTPPSESFIEERWFDCSGFEGHEIEDHYWVQAPFAHVTILYDPEKKVRRYHVTEPVLNEFEEHLRSTLVQVLRSELMYQDFDMSGGRIDVFVSQLKEVVDDYAASAEPGTVHKLTYYLVRDFLHYGGIDPLMRDEDIEDISCDGHGIPVYVYHGTYRDLETNIVFSKDKLTSLTIRLAQMANKQISVSDPLIDGTLPDGSRIQLTLGGDVANRGSNFTIRNFSEIPFTPVDLVTFETFSIEQMAYFWLAIENGKSLMFAGGTGSGKTTSMNAVSFFIPPESKVVTIEDTLEITLPHENWVQLTTRKSASETGKGEIGQYELLESALRQRPEFLLVGEIRTDPNVALTFFQAMNTGHTAYTTFHSDSVAGVLSRLENPPLEIPVQMLRELDIISIQKQVFLGRDRVRRNETVAELGAGEDPTAVEPLTVFERDAERDSFEQVADSHVLESIRTERGWTPEELTDALETRERILRYLIDNDITGYEEVAATIQTYFRDPDYIVDLIDSDQLDPASLPVDI